MLLDAIHTPSDLKKLSFQELETLAEELRQEIVSTVGKNGGHLASNLGSVELCIALHMVFDVPQDAMVFDVGHQAYVHKLLTGRRESFSRLRDLDGCSGFPSMLESPYDTGISGHSGSAVSLAQGIASGKRRDNLPGKAIAVIGDASLNCGVTFEGLNTCSKAAKNLLVVLNDNQMSISRNVGAVSQCLNRIISGSFYNRLRSRLKKISLSRKRLHTLLQRIDDALKSALLPPGVLFQELGFRYFGPVNGHDLPELINLFSRVRNMEEPVFVHVITEKGHGCDFARKSPALYHGVSGYDPKNGKLPQVGSSFSKVFGQKLLKLAAKDQRIEAVSAAMIDGTGLRCFAEKQPFRCHDAGIAEEHAVIFSCGLAIAGKRPVCVLYSTFAQRAFDCIYHDAVLAQLPVVFVLDRAGIVEDGPTHHGIYDIAFLRSLPGLSILAPRNYQMLEAMLEYAFAQKTPVVIRYPRGAEHAAAAEIPAEKIVSGKAQIIRRGDAQLTIFASGAEVGTALETAAILKAENNLNCTIIDPVFLKPFDTETARSFAEGTVVSIEDHSVSGGLGSLLAETLAGTNCRLLCYGWKDSVIPHGKVQDLRNKYGMTARQIARDLQEKLQLPASNAV